MTKHDYVEQQEKTCRDEWFKDHKAVVLSDDRADKPVAGATLLISWQQPGTWNYGCRFIIHRHWLCVVGDIGEATFEWSEDITLEFLSSLDFSYFLSKCRASPEGRKFQQWDGDTALAGVEARLKDLYATGRGDRCLYHDEIVTMLKDLGDNSGGQHEYERTAYLIYDLTGDSELASTVSDFGKVPSVHAIGMFVGLQMAIKQIQNPVQEVKG